MVNYRYIFVLFIFPFILTGCAKQPDLEERDFILALGASYNQNEFQAVFSRPDLGLITGQPAGEEEKLTVSYNGRYFTDTIKNYGRNSKKQLDFNHLKAIILSSRLLKNKEELESFLYSIKEEQSISRNTPVFYTNDDIEELFQMDKKVGGNIGEFLEQMYHNHSSKMERRNTTAGTLISSLYEKDKTVRIPCIGQENDMLSMEGAAFVQNGKWKYDISEEEYEMLQLYFGTGKNYIFSSGSTSQAVEIQRIKSKMTVSLREGKPYIMVKLTGEGKILQPMENDVNSGTGKTDVINQEISELLENQINELNKNGTDGLNLYRDALYKDDDVRERYMGNQDAFLSDIIVRVVTDLNIL